MGKLIFSALAWFSTNLLTRLLAGAGLAIAGNYTFGIFVNYFLNKGISMLSAIPMIGLLGVAGIDDAISILITGAMIQIYLNSVTQGVNIVKGAKK